MKNITYFPRLAALRIKMNLDGFEAEVLDKKVYLEGSAYVKRESYLPLPTMKAKNELPREQAENLKISDIKTEKLSSQTTSVNEKITPIENLKIPATKVSHSDVLKNGSSKEFKKEEPRQSPPSVTKEKKKSIYQSIHSRKRHKFSNNPKFEQNKDITLPNGGQNE